ncbi:uncharacterized protein LOC116118639 [Pistacia vera]|uniref:uncharacterized protein LOC116118639 n=1 Tax=Pistacia vera TaxID=55513 RepID=UPI001262EE79|nr:uncharacterized protein LOC116118639 [Pistacia vera]
MPKLKVLNLCAMQQSSLPSSLDLLTNLRTLCLDYNNIESVAIIGNLKKLEVLSLQHSPIKELPTEIGQLTQLKLFNLSNCWRLEIIAPNVISNLLQLEEFHVGGCPIQWKVEVLEELKLLSQLASLELDIKDKKMLPKDFFSKELKRYKISIGDWSSHYITYDEDEVLRMFELKFNSTISLEELQGIKNVELLRLAEFLDVENSFNEFATLMPLLNKKVIFTNLTTLELNNIGSVKIWDTQFPAPMSSSYQNLTRFILKSCGKIKYVFPSSIAKSLQTLQHLEIMDCEVLEEIVSEEEGTKAAINFAFPQVSYLKLMNLPKLVAFYLGIHINLEDKFVTLMPLLNEKVIFTNLTTLELNNISSRKIWDTQFPAPMSSSYQNLTRFVLKSCGKIKYVFPSSIAKSLQTLQHLEIMDCEVLEEIVAEEERTKAANNFAFPQVIYLKLVNLPKLTVFYPGMDILELPILKRLEVRKCEKFTSKYLSFHENSLHISEPKSSWLANKINSDLEVFELTNGRKTIIWQSQSKVLKISEYKSTDIPLGLLQRFENLNELKLEGNEYKELFFPNLEVLNLSFCYRLMGLLPSLSSFQNLKVLRVYCYNGLMKLITPSTVRSLVQLREMSVRDCGMLTEIIENEGERDATTSTEIVFDNLKTLSLINLESLICFCYGNYSFNFPYLEKLIIRECPNMKTFSQGILSTPKLHKIDYEDEEKDLEKGWSDLNTTIQQAHKK